MLVTLVCHPLSMPKPTGQSSSLRHHVLHWIVRKTATTTKRGSGGRGSQASCSRQARPCSPSPSDHSLHLPSPGHVPSPSLVLEKSLLSPGLADEGVPGPSCLLPEPQVGAKMFHTNQDLRSFSTCVLKRILTTSLPQSLPSATRLPDYPKLPGLLSPNGSSQASSREMDKFSQCHETGGGGD